jgi:SPP1 family predicted phage head-tail adaptor
MERKIARFNERITFQKNTVHEDQYKNRRSRWEDFFTCYAYASTYSGEEEEGEVTYETRVVTFETRCCPELKDVTSTGYRIWFKGEAYDIEYVDHMNYQNQILRFKARREVRQSE